MFTGFYSEGFCRVHATLELTPVGDNELYAVRIGFIFVGGRLGERDAGAATGRSARRRPR